MSGRLTGCEIWGMGKKKKKKLFYWISSRWRSCAKHSCRKAEQQRQPDDIICAGEDGRAGGRGLMQSRRMNAASLGRFLATPEVWGRPRSFHNRGGWIKRYKSALNKQINQCCFSPAGLNCVCLCLFSRVTSVRLSVSNKTGRIPPPLWPPHPSASTLESGSHAASAGRRSICHIPLNNRIHLHNGGTDRLFSLF